jgi:hypothetical protein
LELKPARVNGLPGSYRYALVERLPAEQRQAIFEISAFAAPVSRVGRPEDVVEAVLLLMRTGFVAGSMLEVDGGLRPAGVTPRPPLGDTSAPATGHLSKPPVSGRCKEPQRSTTD